MSIPAEDWNNRLKQFISGLSGLIPEVGGIVKFLLETFWPTSYDDIWTLLEKRIESLIYQIVDQEILKNELAERKAELQGLQNSMAQYVDAKTHEKGGLLSAMLVNANTFFQELDQSTNDVHFLAIAIALVYLHLSLLRERLLHGKEIYDEDNTPTWKKELEDQTKTYQDFFLAKWQKWMKWRYDQIETNYYDRRPGPISPSDGCCDIKDKLSGKSWSYFVPNASSSFLKTGVDMLTSRVFSETIPEMIRMVYTPSFLLTQFLPGHEKDAPVADKSVGVVSLGPFNCATGDDPHQAKDFETFYGSLSTDSPGEIVTVYVREWNSIDGMEIDYKNHNGVFVGNPGGGKDHTFNLAENVVVNYVYMGFANGLLALVHFKFSDGQDTGNLGNRGGWGMRYSVELDQSKLLDENFVLRSINMQPGRGPSQTTGVASLALTYYHKSLL